MYRFTFRLHVRQYLLELVGGGGGAGAVGVWELWELWELQEL